MKGSKSHMVSYTREEALVAKVLMTGKKTPEELCKETSLKKTAVNKALKKLEKVKMAKKYGKKYALAEEVRKEATRGKNWPFKAHIIIEGQSKSKQGMEKSQKDLISKLTSDKIIAINDLVEHEILEEDGIYSSLFECDVSTNTFEDMAYVALNYGPSSIMLETPDKYELKTSEMNGILMDTATVLHAYVNMIADLKFKLDDERITIK